MQFLLQKLELFNKILLIYLITSFKYYSVVLKSIYATLQFNKKIHCSSVSKEYKITLIYEKGNPALIKRGETILNYNPSILIHKNVPVKGKIN